MVKNRHAWSIDRTIRPDINAFKVIDPFLYLEQKPELKTLWPFGIAGYSPLTLVAFRAYGPRIICRNCHLVCECSLNKRHQRYIPWKDAPPPPPPPPPHTHTHTPPPAPSRLPSTGIHFTSVPFISGVTALRQNLLLLLYFWFHPFFSGSDIIISNHRVFINMLSQYRVQKTMSDLEYIFKNLIWLHICVAEWS